MNLFHFNVGDEPVEVERGLWEGIGYHVSILTSEAGVFKHSFEEMDMADWAETFFAGCFSVVQGLVEDPHVCD